MRSPFITKAALVATLMAMSPSMVLAQTSTGFLGVRPVIAQSPGEYTYKTLDQATLNEQILSRLDKSRDYDKLYVTQTVEELNEAFVKLQNTEYLQLQRAAMKSTRSAVSYIDYVSLTNAYISKRVEINALIGNITKLPSALKTSANSARTGNAIVELPGQLQVDFSEVLAHFNSQLDIVDSRAQSLSFTVALPNGATQIVNNINGEGIDKANLLSQEVLEKMSLDLRRAKAMVLDNNAKLQLKNVNAQTLSLVTSYINNQGKTERWRFNNIKDAINQSEIKDLTDAFWLRSLIRAKYGVPVGGLGLNYKKRGLHIDKLFASNNIEIVQNISGTADLNTYSNLTREALKTLDGAVNLSGNPLSIVKWAVTRVKGNWNEATANLIVANLLAADLLEEKMILEGGGLRKMHAHYKARYGANPDMKNYYKNLTRAFEGRDDDAFGDVGIANADSMRGIYSMAKPTLDLVLVRQQRADNLSEAFKKITASMQTMKKADKRVDSLLD